MALGDFLFPNVELELVIAHSFEADIESTKDILSKEFVEIAARVRLSNGVFKRLGLKDGGHADIRSDAGNIVLAAYGDENVPEGTAVVPYSPWALALVSAPKDDSPPKYNGVKVTVMRTNEDITPLEQLLQDS
jgi:formylmethanofuran dehydrogenase subunit D